MSLHRVGASLVAAALVLVPAACSGEDGDAQVTVAEARVAAKEKALADAESAATAAKADFCTASRSYITALDRYGDILNETGPTVGDVRSAGEDLEEPAAEAAAAADEVVAAAEDVATAEQELADARADLAAAEAARAGEPAPTPTAGSPEPSPSQAPASVARVEQAQADFDAARAGITDETPLDQASEQFNAAAVALEIAWLQLFRDSGCLSDAEAEQAAEAVAAYTTALQQDLKDAGYFSGEVDGVYGPETVAAVEALQKANGLPQTGTVDKATEEALRDELAEAGGAAAQQETASTAAVQQTLKLAGYWDGPVDGVWTDELTDALTKLQEDLGVEPTGTVDAATVTALEQAIADRGATSSPSASPTASASTSPTG